MATPMTQEEKTQRGAQDSGRYFRTMTEFVGFNQEDVKAIKESRLVIEKHIPRIVSDFYENLLRYPPTRQHFLKNDGNLDQDYLQKRMAHLTNFWRRTAGGDYDDEYARYVDYVGRAHTSHGADPTIYIAERYVIGQVGFMQHAIHQGLSKELHEYDPELEGRAITAWNKLMMVILEMLARAYRGEHEEEPDLRRLVVDVDAMRRMAVNTYEIGLGLTRPRPVRTVEVARVEEILEDERKIIEAEGLSIGVFHHRGGWYAVHNHCLHRGGPVATGALEGDVLICPWHGYQYEVTSGKLLVDSSVRLDMYPVSIEDGIVYISLPVQEWEAEGGEGENSPDPVGLQPALAENELLAANLLPGQMGVARLEGQEVAVYNLGGHFYATQERCTHAGGPLHEGELDGQNVVCPWHGSCFNVTNGAVTCPPAEEPLQTFRVDLDGEILRVSRG